MVNEAIISSDIDKLVDGNSDILADLSFEMADLADLTETEVNNHYSQTIYLQFL